MLRTWHFIIPFMAAISLINIILLIIVSIFTIVERAKYHTNYTAIRLQFYFASTIFCIGTFLESLAVQRIKFHGEFENIYGMDYSIEDISHNGIPPRYFLLTGSAMHMQMTSVPFIMERTFATFFSRNYETKKEFLVLVPIFAIFTSAAAWSFGYIIVYVKFSIIITLLVLIALNFMAYISLLILNYYNRRLAKILNTGLSQRYQVMENKRVIERLKILFILDTFIHAWALLSGIFVHIAFAAKETFTDSIVSYCILMNLSLTMMQIFTIRYSIKKHMILRRILKKTLPPMKIHSKPIEVNTMARKIKIQTESDNYFIMLNESWK